MSLADNMRTIALESESFQEEYTKVKDYIHEMSNNGYFEVTIRFLRNYDEYPNNPNVFDIKSSRGIIFMLNKGGYDVSTNSLGVYTIKW